MQSPDTPVQPMHGTQDTPAEAGLRVIRQPQAWTFVLARPDKRNALSSELVEALIAAMQEAHAANVAMVVLTGEGANLSAGFDFTGHQEQSEGDLVLRFIRIETLLQLMARSSCLTVGFAHGRNFGAGVDLFAACQLRYCTSDTTFRMPGLKFGLVLGSRRFRSIVGTATALSTLGNARTFTAEQAVQMGFVHHVAQTEAWPELQEQALQTALALDSDTRKQLYDVLDENQADADMAALVRSAASPGLKRRIEAYLKA